MLGQTLARLANTNDDLDRNALKLDGLALASIFSFMRSDNAHMLPHVAVPRLHIFIPTHHTLGTLQGLKYSPILQGEVAEC
jgi:hypothetical protein